MRVLIAHNRYRSGTPSGENIVVDREVDLLASRGHDVETFFRSNDDYADLSAAQKIRTSASPVFGSSARKDFQKSLRAFRPDVVHVHNVYPLISPMILDDCREAGVPVFATIHNFRLRCIKGTFFRDGQICTDCEGRRFPTAGIVHGCYGESIAASSVMAIALARHRPRWEGIDGFIAVSDFVADYLVKWGIDRSLVHVIPNPVEDPGEPSPPGEGFVFAARLTEDKGLLLVLDAWEASGLDGTIPLYIAGDGPLRGEAEQRAARLTSVQVLGPLTGPEVQALRRKGAVGLQPSLWFEAHPSVAESFALGRPVLATNVGAADSVVNDQVGWRSPPTVASFADAFRTASDPREVVARGAAARSHYERTYEPAVVASQLESRFSELLTRPGQQGRSAKNRSGPR